MKPDQRSNLARRELTPSEWARVRRVIDFIPSQPKAGATDEEVAAAPQAAEAKARQREEGDER